MASQSAATQGKCTVVFVRHGQSIWNLENKFTGWVDVPLSDQGREEAKQAGKLLKEHSFTFDLVYSSVLKRSIQTTHLVLDEMDSLYVEEKKSFHLNERMYGALAGLNKQETVEKYGHDQVMIWRRSYDVPPPEASEDHPYFPLKHQWAHNIPREQLPHTESLKTTLDRVLPYWNDVIMKSVKEGRRVLVSAHGNSIRAILKYIDNIPEDVITKIDIPTGVPLVYEFNEDFSAPIKLENSAEHLSGRYLLDPQEVKARIEAVKRQTAAQ